MLQPLALAATFQGVLPRRSHFSTSGRYQPKAALLCASQRTTRRRGTATASVARRAESKDTK